VSKSKRVCGVITCNRKREICRGSWWENLKETDNMKNLDIDGMIITKWILKKHRGSACIDSPG
jgi:hypothetical protein